ncbi:uncharacterized protein LOC122087434 [Macadamia integrifolia]|uniref:uncharacterized protein LOC122087434 n=1 Tax=Macadamia integrifolia TaxID=60698 RepID=UPI001C4F0D60|nr:uncharacterized protein LOC122087434 [Macadamia integrifolia]XP_042512505.1 uncharacterized protein LOC122087434 [Macadamia integrifolia]XP_042512506.1 uncharacterized protein LOC122087434 [Macadamia integrifolia]XP_042512507.1 uncharacterized protein LOC122087434 [Macadamia integrifolia]XP_042512508.1 uncharacterized protein LOC122087434 [Macadamia integrifolia]
MDDPPVQRIAISGPTLASIIQRFSSSNGDVDGLLFGHVTHLTPSNLPDDDGPASSSSTSSFSDSPLTVVATITCFLCSGTVSSFYDSLGRLDLNTLRRFLGNRGPGQSLIGWFMGRRRTPPRPSMREYSVSASLCNKALNLVPPDDPLSPFNLPPCVFVVFSTPFSNQLIHTHEHRAFQFRRSTCVFEPKSLDVVNIGPAFRGHYGAFSPNSPFPWLSCGSSDSKEKSSESLSQIRRASKEQQLLDSCAKGYEIGRLSRLMGSEAANYTSELEGLYGKMLAKLEGLARLVEQSSAMVIEQENQNVKLRLKVAGLE